MSWCDIFKKKAFVVNQLFEHYITLLDIWKKNIKYIFLLIKPIYSSRSYIDFHEIVIAVKWASKHIFFSPWSDLIPTKMQFLRLLLSNTKKKESRDDSRNNRSKWCVSRFVATEFRKKKVGIKTWGPKTRAAHHHRSSRWKSCPSSFRTLFRGNEKAAEEFLDALLAVSISNQIGTLLERCWRVFLCWWQKKKGS